MYTPTPYAGKDKYIFISYSHRDTYQVFPIITKLMENGYRVWFDAGIDPGTEWDENIAQHINECGYFIAFMSSSYLGSNNCKDELNYARDLEKERLIVYLEDVQLPAGLAMRVNRLQSIFKYTYVNEDEFYAKLFAAKNIETCCERKVQTPPPVEPVKVQTPPPVEPVKVQTPPPAEPKKPQVNQPNMGEIPTYTQRVNQPETKNGSQTMPKQPVQPNVPPQTQPVKPQVPPQAQTKTKPNKTAVILLLVAAACWIMSINYSSTDSATLGAVYCSMIAAGIALLKEQGSGWRVLITVVYFLDVLSLWIIMGDRVYWGYGDEKTQYTMVIVWTIVYFLFRKASLKKVKKN